MGDFISFNYRKRFEEERKTPAIIKATTHYPSFGYVEWLEDLLEQHTHKQTITIKSSGDVKPVMFCKGKSIISGYKTRSEDADKIISLIDEMTKFGADVTLQYCPRDTIFTILTDTEMLEAVFREIKMFAKGFLKASNITITEER